MSGDNSASLRRSGGARLIAIVRSSLGIALFVVFIILYALFSLLTLRRFSLSLSAPALKLMSRISTAITGVKVRLVEPTPYQEPAPRLIITNHLSTLDLFWFTAEPPPRLFTLGKKEIRWIPPLNLAWWVFRLGYIDRGAREIAIESLNRAGERTISEVRSLCLSPEGTRSRDGKLGPFKKGPFHLAIQHQLPIYPVVAAGAFELMPRGQGYSWPGEIWVRPLPPILTEGLGEADVEALIERAHTTMGEAYEELTAALRAAQRSGEERE